MLEKETKVKLKKKSLYDRPDKSSVYPILDAIVKSNMARQYFSLHSS